MLKRYDCHFYFEVEDLYTEDQQSETLLSQAEQTSRSKSGNIKWGIRRNIEKEESLKKTTEVIAI